MNREESFIFMKKIHVTQEVEQRDMYNAPEVRHLSSDNSNNSQAFIQVNTFMKAVEMVMNDVRHDPYILTLKLLTTLYSGHETITLVEFKKFFARFETYFHK